MNLEQIDSTLAVSKKCVTAFSEHFFTQNFNRQSSDRDAGFVSKRIGCALGKALRESDAAFQGQALDQQVVIQRKHSEWCIGFREGEYPVEATQGFINVRSVARMPDLKEIVDNFYEKNVYLMIVLL